MDYKLIFRLSLFGVFMGIATISWIPENYEHALWWIITLGLAFLLVRYAHGKYFLHGLILSLLNFVWQTVIHILFLEEYVKNNIQIANSLMLTERIMSPQVSLLEMGIVAGILYGLVLGTLAFIGAKLLKKRKNDVVE